MDLHPGIRDKIFAFVEGDVVRGSRHLPAHVVVGVLKEADLYALAGLPARSRAMVAATLDRARARFITSSGGL